MYLNLDICNIKNCSIIIAFCFDANQQNLIKTKLTLLLYLSEMSHFTLSVYNVPRKQKTFVFALAHALSLSLYDGASNFLLAQGTAAIYQGTQLRTDTVGEARFLPIWRESQTNQSN